MWREYAGGFEVLPKVWRGCNRAIIEQRIAHRNSGGSSACVGTDRPC